MQDNTLPVFCEKVHDEIIDQDNGYTVSLIETDPLYKHEVINLHRNDAIECPYEYTMALFVDLHPKANWGHECKYILFNLMNPNQYTIHDRTMPPEEEWMPMESCSTITG